MIQLKHKPPKHVNRLLKTADKKPVKAPSILMFINTVPLGAFFFNGPGQALRRAQPFFFAAPGGPKLARPLSSAVIGHAHLPRFSCLQMASASDLQGKMIIVS